MKKIMAVAVLAAASFVSPSILLISPAQALACTGPNVPDAWKRPGGFCALGNATGSLALPQAGQQAVVPGSTSVVVVDTGCDTYSAIELKTGDRVHVAGNVEHHQWSFDGGSWPCYDDHPDPCSK